MADQTKKAIVKSADLPPVSPGNKRIIKYRIINEDNAALSDWSTVYFVSGEDLVTVDAVITVNGTSSFLATWGDENQRPSYDVFVSYGIDVASWARVSTTVTLTLSAPHTFAVGDLIDVRMAGGAAHIGLTNVPITGTTTTTISYTCSASGNNSGTEKGAVYLSDNYAISDKTYFYHGTTSTHQYSFLAYPYSSAKAVIQIEGTTKKIDASTRIAVANRVYTFVPGT